jgi:putative transposase
MNTYKRHRFSHDIISYVIWLYFRLNLSHRDIEDVLAERGVIVSRDSIRLWRIKFGALYTRRLKRKHCGYGDTFYIDEVFVKNSGEQHYLWRAVDQDGEVVEAYLHAKRDEVATKRFFRHGSFHGISFSQTQKRLHKSMIYRAFSINMAPDVGIEPTTH